MARIQGALVISTLFVFILCGRFAHAWDGPGHEVIAYLADSRLNPKARQAVNDLAHSLSTPGPPYDAITIACWMDDLKRKDISLPEHGLFFTWHYIDLGIDPGDPVPSFQPGDDNEFRGNIVQALKRSFVVLRGGTDPYIKSKAIACAMMMHLVGDIHQPLHAATHYFQTAGGWTHHDAGGSKEYLINGPANDPHFSLHKFWDSAWRASFDEITGLVVINDQPYDLGAIQSAAREVAVHPAPPPVADEPPFEQWAQESHQIAENFVYREITSTDNKKYCRLSSSYVGRARSIAQAQMDLAAFRLAAILNQTLGAANPSVPPPSYPASPPGQSYESGP